jgi:hypothetical protein
VNLETRRGKGDLPMTKIVSTDKARQGRWGRRVLIVLVAGLLLSAVAWAIAELYGTAIEPSQPAVSTMN